MITPQQVKDLAYLNGQASALANKPSLSKSEQRQWDLLLTQIAAVKSGASLEELMVEQTNDAAKRSGLPTVRKDNSLTPERREIAEGFLALLKSGREVEYRDQGVGTSVLSGEPGGVLQGNLGSFVPTGFWYQIKAAMKAADPLLNEDVVTLVTSPKGGPFVAPYYSDIENTATIVGEGSDQSGNETDLYKPAAAVLNAFSFRSPLWRVSLESVQDVQSIGGVLPLFEQFCADRTARGVGKYLVTGSGSGQPLGIVTALQALGINPIVAAGSSANTGGSETGANSIGSIDIAKLVFAVDEKYRRSPKIAFICNDNTRQYLATIVTKSGLPLLNWYGGDAYMLGYPVLTSPSMPSIGNGNYPIVFGDWSYFMVRNVTSGQRVQIFKEAPGLLDKGEIGMRFYDRWDCGLLYNDTAAPSPFSFLVTHS